LSITIVSYADTVRISVASDTVRISVASDSACCEHPAELVEEYERQVC
jgi:hypothetical protein